MLGMTLATLVRCRWHGLRTLLLRPAQRSRKKIMIDGPHGIYVQNTCSL